MDRVVALPELLENILVFLPTRDLLLAQGVNRYFKDLIESSPTLQQALFFHPRPSRLNGTITHYRTNDLLQEIFPAWFMRAVSVREQHLGIAHYESGSFGHLKAYKCETSAKALTRKEASWRRMFVTQPPIRWMPIVHFISSITGEICNIAELRYPAHEGLRMDCLYDLAFDHFTRNMTSFQFGIRWHCLPDIDRAEFLLGNGVIERVMPQGWKPQDRVTFTLYSHARASVVKYQQGWDDLKPLSCEAFEPKLYDLDWRYRVNTDELLVRDDWEKAWQSGSQR